MSAKHFTSADSYRHDIDGLRAIAVLAVIVSHIDADILPSGYLGVDMFFVISGFVISTSLAHSKSKTLGEFLLGFYQRRIKRLVPALVFFVVITAIAIALVDELARTSLKTGAAALLGLSNVGLAIRSTDYFAQSAELNAFLHTWSLGVEEQFYLIYPLLFWFAFIKIQSRFRIPTLFWVIFILSAVSLATFFMFYDRYQSYVYFLMPTRFWELGAGALAYAIYASSSKPIARLRSFPPMVPLGLLFIVFFSPVKFAPENTLSVVLLTVLLIITIREQTFTYSILTTRALVYVGLISYSLYLWHWGVLVMARLTVGVTIASVPFLIAIMFLTASFSYFFIEMPLRYRQWTPSKFVDVALGATISLFGFVVIFMASTNYHKINLANILGYNLEHIQKTWWEDRITGQYLEVCHASSAYNTDLLDRCIPEEGAHPRYILIGDSHARNYLETIRDAFDNQAVSYLTMGHHCAYLPDNLVQRLAHTRCPSYVEEVTDRIREIAAPGDVIFIGQRIWERPERWNPSYFQFLSLKSELFNEQGARVVLLDGTYPPKLDPRFCVDLPWRPLRNGCSISEDEVQSAFADFDSQAHELAKRHEGIYYASLRSKLCVDKICGPTSKSGHAVWHDVGHITEKAAKELSPALIQQLAEQGFYD